MTPLIDADVLLHELGWSGEFKDGETGELVLFPFEKVQELLDAKIELICDEVGASKPPILFLSNTEFLSEKLKCPFIPNFRYAVAKTKPYKGTRKNPKPFHFYNITVYLLANYNCVVSRGGVEADDMMCIHQSSSAPESTIICSRDKDLRICPGWHYSWECGKQASVGPTFTDRFGSLQKGGNGKTLGYGLKFFFYQLLTGDTADNIPGLPLVGDVKAYKLLKDVETEREAYDIIVSLYKEKKGVEAKNFFREQADLLWMQQADKPKYKIGDV